MPKNGTEFLRMSAKGRPIGVDRKNAVINGFVVAQLGVFKDQRGEFIEESLSLIQKLGNEAKQGLRSRFSHPTECSSGLGNFLGRARDFFLSETATAEGKTVPAVRADLHLDKTALEDSPNGGTPLGIYVMNLVESDSAAISSSLVLRARKEKRRNADGSMMLDAEGEPVPPIWFPTHLAATDVVDDGAAVDGILSVDGLDKEHLWQATALLDSLFDDMSRAEVLERLTGFRDRYLNHRFGEEEAEQVTSDIKNQLEADKMAVELRHRRNRNLSRVA